MFWGDIDSALEFDQLPGVRLQIHFAPRPCRHPACGYQRTSSDIAVEFTRTDHTSHSVHVCSGFVLAVSSCFGRVLAVPSCPDPTSSGHTAPCIYFPIELPQNHAPQRGSRAVLERVLHNDPPEVPPSLQKPRSQKVVWHFRGIVVLKEPKMPLSGPHGNQTAAKIVEDPITGQSQKPQAGSSASTRRSQKLQPLDRSGKA